MRTLDTQHRLVETRGRSRAGPTLLSGSAHMNDLHTSIARAVLRIGLGAVPRLRRADTSPRESRAVVDAPLQKSHDTHGAFAGELEIILESERPDRLIVGVSHDQHTARHLVQRTRQPL